MGLAYTTVNKRGKQQRQRKKRRSVLGWLFVWFRKLDSQAIGPFITLSSLVAALVAVNVTTAHFETDALTKRLSNDRTGYDVNLSKIQSDIESRIPDSVRSPLPIFPENGQTLLLRPKGETTTLELEWADRDREHRHQYVVQLVCIAKSSLREEARCRTDNLDDDKLDKKDHFHWTQPGVDSLKVPIPAAGTYAWRVARGEIDDNEDATIFEEWSPYFIFTMFQSYSQRVYTMNEVLIGAVEGSALQKEGKGSARKEKGLVDLIQEKQFNKKPKRYRSYSTYEALIAAVARGEVDYAIGEITRAKYREKHGIFFTRGYNDALPIFVSKQSVARSPQDGDTIGVVIGSLSEQALIHLESSKKFAIVREFTLDALEDALKIGNANFIFSERLLRGHRISDQTSTQQDEFVSGGTLYGELKDFYDEQLGYPAMHAIATADQSLCKNLDWLVADDFERHSNEDSKHHSYYDRVMQRIYAIYHEEGETLLNRSLYQRLIGELFHSDKPACADLRKY